MDETLNLVGGWVGAGLRSGGNNCDGECGRNVEWNCGGKNEGNASEDEGGRVWIGGSSLVGDMLVDFEGECDDKDKMG